MLRSADGDLSMRLLNTWSVGLTRLKQKVSRQRLRKDRSREDFTTDGWFAPSFTGRSHDWKLTARWPRLPESGSFEVATVAGVRLVVGADDP